MNEYSSVAARRSVAVDAALHPALQRFIEGRLRDRSDSEDIVQETFLRLYDYSRTRTVADVGAFCFAVARNLIRDHVRRRRAAPLTEEPTEAIACPAPRADEILGYRERVDVLLGRRTYDLWSKFWPKASGPMADRLNAATEHAP